MKGTFKMMLLFLCLLTLHCPAEAKSSRTVYLSEGEMVPIYVEPGYSTLLKFSSHPEPGLIGDQDGFKVEYMKSIVAIKPLLPRGQTNLFVFTKDGQFGFQLVAKRGQHDNVVYVEPRRGPGPSGPTTTKTVVLVDELFTKRINKTTKVGSLALTLESVAMPTSRSTLVLRLNIQETLIGSTKPSVIDPKFFGVVQGANAITVENIFLELKYQTVRTALMSGLILVRASDLKKNEPVKLVLNMPGKSPDQKPMVLTVPFSADLH
jgi:hypothetical protein